MKAVRTIFLWRLIWLSGGLSVSSLARSFGRADGTPVPPRKGLLCANIALSCLHNLDSFRMNHMATRPSRRAVSVCAFKASGLRSEKAGSRSSYHIAARDHGHILLPLLLPSCDSRKTPYIFANQASPLAVCVCPTAG